MINQTLLETRTDRPAMLDSGIPRRTTALLILSGLWLIIFFASLFTPPLLDDAYSLAKWLSHSPTDAEDIVQDAAIRALQALATVSVDRPKPWFLAIVRNAAMTFMARNRRKTVAYVGDMADLDTLDLPQGEEAAPNAEQELIALEDSERLRKAVEIIASLKWRVDQHQTATLGWRHIGVERHPAINCDRLDPAVAAKIAQATAGAIGGVPVSPTPPMTPQPPSTR